MSGTAAHDENFQPENDLSTTDGLRRTMVDIAISRLDADDDVKRILYIESDAVPKEMSEIFSKLVDGELTEDAAREALQALREDPSVKVPDPKELGIVDVSSFAQEVKSEREQLEAEVRASLIHQHAERVDKLLKDPEIQEIAKKVSMKTFEHMIDSTINRELESGLMAPEDAQSEREEALSHIKEEVDSIYEDSEQRYAIALQQATDQYSTLAEAKAKVALSFVQAEASGVEIPESVYTELEVIHGKLVPIFEPVQQVVALVTDLAAEVGVEEATTKERVNEKTREVFRTPDEYREHLNEGKRITLEYIERLAQLFASIDEGGKVAGEMVITAVQNALELTEEIRQRQLPATLKEIYGE